MTRSSPLSFRPLAALAVAAGLLVAGTAHAEVYALVGGDAATGDQATLLLDGSVPNALSYDRPVGGGTVALAYFSSHLFCIDTLGTASQTTLAPRNQVPVTVGEDVWKFPPVNIRDLEYVPGGIRIGHAAQVAQRQYRCLTASPGANNQESWNASIGLLTTGFGDYIGANNAGVGVEPQQQPPSGPHQNLKVTAQSFTGFAGREVAVVRLEAQLDATTPSRVDAMLVEGYNAKALGSSATWCLLRPDWVDGTAPPATLCDDTSIVYPGLSKQTGEFARVGVGFYPSFAGPFHVLVYRQATGTPSAGVAKQGFAILRLQEGLAGVPEEMQDWYPHDSVWYSY